MAKEKKTNKAKTKNKETLGFETEVNQLLKLMVHSLYSNKEIFLRELLSNASDACDKLRFEAIKDSKLFEEDSDLKIDVFYDFDKKTITISDNGIGMSRDEVIENIGTIAKSGTKEFFAKLTGDQAKDASLIGQFGVGFYSSFIVGKNVTLTTRRAGTKEADGVKWTSEGEGEYTLEAFSKKQRGTEVMIELKDGEDDLLSLMRLKNIVTKYSDHIAIPIMMFKEDWDKDKSTYVKTDDLEQINQASAIWVRAKSDISNDQYEEFYKHLSHDMEGPMAWTHNKVEGRQEYTQLLYLPSKAPFDLFERDSKHGIKLYVKRVFIMDDAEHLIPNYLRFIKGVIDSSDLPLNISREILQESKNVEAIRKGCVSRILGLLESMASEDTDKYLGFWKEFGRVLKEGIGEDFGNQERISKLLRFATTKTQGEAQNVSLAEYVDRMSDGQDKIYYVTAETFSAAESSPHLEIFREKDIEVLLLSDRVDEWVVSNLPEFSGKKLSSISRGELDLGDIAEDEKSKRDKESENFKELIGKIKNELSQKVIDVRVTFRLKESPACLVAAENGMSINLERMLKAAGQNVPSNKPILEINPYHPIVKSLNSSRDGQNLADWSKILFDQAVLAEGGTPEDPAQFVKLLNSMMIKLTGDEKKVWTPS